MTEREMLTRNYKWYFENPLRKSSSIIERFRSSNVLMAIKSIRFASKFSWDGAMNQPVAINAVNYN